MTITTPLRLMILHFSQRGLTDALTFIELFSSNLLSQTIGNYTTPVMGLANHFYSGSAWLLVTVGNTSPGQIVR